MPPTSFIIETPRLQLQELSVEEHAEGLHQIFSNELAMQWLPTLKTKSLEETKSMLQKEVPSPERPWVKIYAIMLRSAEENQGVKPCVIGKIGMLPLMGCYLHPDFWRKGYATEAARALLAYYWTLPENLHKQEISGAIDVQNMPSIKLAEKMGLRKGETYRKISGVGNITMYHASRPPAIAKYIEPPGKEQGYVMKKERFWMQHMSIEEHLQGYYEMWLHPKSSNFSTQNIKKHTLETSLDHLTLRVRSEANPYIQNFAILEPPAPNAPPNSKLRFIGVIGCIRFPKTFIPTNPDPGEPEIGYQLHPDFWGKGYATEALKACLEYYWNISEAPHVNVKSIVAFYQIENVGSGRVLEKVGFEEREVIKDYQVEDGRMIDYQVCWIRRPS